MAFWSRNTPAPAPTSATPQSFAPIDAASATALIGRDAAPPPAPADYQDPGTKGTLRRAYDGLVNFLAGLGTERDRNTFSSYAPIIPLNQMDLENMYRGSWLPRRIIDCVTEDMTREWFKISWEGHDTDANGPRAITAEENRVGVRANVTEGIRWGKLFGGAGTVLGIKGQKLNEPLDLDTIQKGDLEWLATRDRWWLAPSGELITEPGPLSGFPMYYNLVDASGFSGGATVHYTRVIRWGGAPLPVRAWLANARWDDSVLQSALDAIKRYDTLTGGIGSLIWDSKVDVMSIDQLREMLADEEGENELRKRFSQTALAKSMFNVLLMDGRDKYEQKQYSFGGLKDILEEFRTEVCGAVDIPMTRLFGQSPGGLNATGESDLVNYENRLKSEQSTRVVPNLTTLYGAVVRSALGEMPQQMEIKPNPLRQMTEKEQGDIEKLRSDRDKTYVDMGAIPVSVVTRSLKDARTYGGALQDEDVAMVEKLEKAPPPPPPAAPAVPPKGAPPAGTGAPKGQPPAGSTPSNPGTAAAARATPPEPGRDSAARDIVRQEQNGWNVYSETGEKHLGGPYQSKAEALERLDQVEFFKAHDVAVTDATQLHSFMFEKKRFDQAGAEAWLRRNGKKSAIYRENDEALEYRQEYADNFEPDSFRQIAIAPGISAIIGHPRPKNDELGVVARRQFQGFNVAIENPAGTARRWYDKDMRETGMVMMRNDYGFLEDHLGVDGEELDVYLGPDQDAEDVHVVHQLKGPDYTSLDEDKVMLGFRDGAAAKAAYLAHRSDGALGSRAFGSMATIPVERFRAQLKRRSGLGKIRS